MIFTSEKIDKSDELVDAVKNFTIKDAKYYESNTATASDAHGDLTRNPETVTNTNNGNETVTRTSSRDFEQKIFSNQTIPVLPLTMNQDIDQGIAPIILEPQTLLMPVTKEVVADMALGSTCINRNLRRFSMTDVISRPRL